MKKLLVLAALILCSTAGLAQVLGGYSENGVTFYSGTMTGSFVSGGKSEYCSFSGGVETCNFVPEKDTPPFTSYKISDEDRKTLKLAHEAMDSAKSNYDNIVAKLKNDKVPYRGPTWHMCKFPYEYDEAEVVEDKWVVVQHSKIEASCGNWNYGGADQGN